MRRRRFLTLAAAFACAPRLATASTWTGRALGADVSVTLHGPRQETDAALKAIPPRLDRIERLFSLHRSDSALTFLNLRGRLDKAPTRFLDLTLHAHRVHRLTDGLFDPTVQPLWHALAMGQDTTAARRLIGWGDVTIDALDTIRLGPGQQLTFNGIAQGYATDLIRKDLAERGFTKALIDIGEHAAIGGPFHLALADPTHGPIGQRTITDSAIATSSPGALRLGAETHILSPDGRPPLWSTVSIEGPSATMADAFSTAAVFMDHTALDALKRTANLHRITTIATNGDLTTL